MKAYFFDIYCDGVYIWREGYQLSPQKIKEKAKRLLNLKRWVFVKTLEVRVTDVDTDELVMSVDKT